MIDRFLDYMRYERNCSQETILRYGRSLRDFEVFFKNEDAEMDWTTVDADVVRNWLMSLMDTGHKATSVNADLAAIRSFYRFALKRHLVEKDPARMVTGPKKQKPLPQFVKEGEMNELLDQYEWGDDYEEVLARTIIILLYETGLRRSELVGLNDSDVDWAMRQLKVTGKRNKQRIVPFGDELADELKRYVELRNKEVARQTNALFVGKKGLRLYPDKVYGYVKKYLSLVTTMQKRSPHVLRHSFATAMLNHGAGLESVRMLLGHESLKTTEVYTHTTFEQLKRVYEEAHPRGDTQ